MRIDSIADHLDWIPLIARWHWDEWGHTDPNSSLAEWTQGLSERTRRDQVPTTYVAIEHNRPIGSVTLVEHDMDDHTDLSPWLAGLYVEPTSRRQGFGSALVNHLLECVKHMGIPTLYLYTESARHLYEQLGWEMIEETSYQGHVLPVSIMRFRLEQLP